MWLAPDAGTKGPTDTPALWGGDGERAEGTVREKKQKTRPRKGMGNQRKTRRNERTQKMRGKRGREIIREERLGNEGQRTGCTGKWGDKALK